MATKNKQILQLRNANRGVTARLSMCEMKLKYTQKVLSRSKGHAPGACSAADSKPTVAQSSPLKRAHADIQEAGISPTKSPNMITILEAHHTIINEMGKHLSAHKKRSVVKSLSVSSTRPITKLANACKLIRTTLQYKQRGKRRSEVALTRQTVRKFYYRDDVSSCLAGKKDFVKVGKLREQKIVMSDTLRNAHAKFKLAHPTTAISCATFKRLRPKNVVTVSFLSRITCLCKQHQNFSLVLQGLRKSGVRISNIPDEVARVQSGDEFTKLVTSSYTETVHFQQWERVEVTYGIDGKTCKKVKLVDKKMSREQFGGISCLQFTDFIKHRERVIAQYNAARQIKAKMPPGHISVQCVIV